MASHTVVTEHRIRAETPGDSVWFDHGRIAVNLEARTDGSIRIHVHSTGKLVSVLGDERRAYVVPVDDPRSIDELG